MIKSIVVQIDSNSSNQIDYEKEEQEKYGNQIERTREKESELAKYTHKYKQTQSRIFSNLN